MTTIIKAKLENVELLTSIGKISFRESHGSSASKETIDNYVSRKYTDDIFQGELNDDTNIIYIIYHDNEPAGYSKIILNKPDLTIPHENVTKLERLYLLKEFYSLKLGWELLNFNIELSKKNNQIGMWLFVWKENHRAVKFYEKAGFKIIGSHDFELTENHSNPNYQMLLKF